jgi:uncharacterized protein (DUF885 family)
MRLGFSWLLSRAACLLALGISALPLDSAPAAARRIIEGKSAVPDSQRLKELFDEHWKYSMEESPESATAAGYAGFNDRWSDLSPEAIERRKQDLTTWLAAIDSIERARLSTQDELNYDLFRRELSMEIEGARFPGELMPINQMGGVQQDIPQVISLMPFKNEKDYRDALARIRSAPKLIAQTIALLRRGLDAKLTPPRIILRDVPQQIANEIVEDLTANPIYAPFTNFPASFSAELRSELTNEAAAEIRGELLPAWRNLSTFFTDEYLPKTRESIAAIELPNGKAWYAYDVRRYTTTELNPAEIHQIGLAEVTRIRAEMDKVIKRAKFAGSFQQFTRFLRSDPQFFYSRTEDLLTGYRDVAKRADPQLARLFGKLPRLPYGVIPIPSYAEKSQTAAYYQPGANAFGRPGYFCANTYELTMRPKWEMEALTLHEAVPGHHLQIALAQEMENMPDFRKHSGYTAFVEGWGLYAESLGEEMGFYQDPYTKFGQLTYEIWRAVRLVVDTGMHSMGWSRQQAIDYFKENSAKTEHDITVEIDRYIAWPGQALAYKIGELKMKELRRRAQDQLKSKFDIREFHDQLLAQGAVPLDVLEKRMIAWIQEKSARAE